MNIKDMVVPLVLAIATTWAIQYFFFGKKDTTDQHQFTAPQTAVECVPLQKEIEFATLPKGVVPRVIPIETSWGNLEFSTDGAALMRLEFKRKMNGDTRTIGTIFPPEVADRENRAFLVGLQDQTPYAYRFIGQKDTGSTLNVTFEGVSDRALIRKTFIIYKEIHQIDLKLDLEPRQNSSVQLRIFYPAPIMPELKDQGQTAADVMYGADVFKKIYRDSVAPDMYWTKPSLFGAENKYFAHTLVSDAQSFVQRGYYKLVGKDQLIAIVEGLETDKANSWTVSFYVGPKESGAMGKVDTRLEQMLDYSGIWAPISRILLLILNWLFGYLQSYGWAIVVLTLLIKLVLLPFSVRADRGMKDRTEMQKRLQYIKQKYKDDPQARAQAQAEFMRKNGLGLAGCLPMLMQIPVFFGLSRVLSSSIELYQAPFLWMSDLSAKDPYYILPAFVMIGMLGSALTATDAKQRLPILAMAVAFGAISASLSAGLVLYIALNTVLQVAQTRVFKLLRLV